MRIAYYGLSSPIFYDYKIQVEKTMNDTWDSPNPILDSGFGTILLYDEIWFFCESLCPQNMRNLPYVKFIDKFWDLKMLKTINTENIWKELGGKEGASAREYNLSQNYNIFHDVVSRIGIRWESAADNHSRPLKVGENVYTGNSMTPDNILFDLATVELLKEKFKGKKLELITNSFTQSYLDSSDSILAKSHLTELLVIDNIPSYLSIHGPYHQCIEEVRDNSYLKSYRDWISNQSLKYDPVELVDVKKEIENVISQAQKKQFLSYLNPELTFKSITKTIIGAIADEILPFASTVKGIFDDIVLGNEKKKIMWQGFIITAKDQIR